MPEPYPGAGNQGDKALLKQVKQQAKDSKSVHTHGLISRARCLGVAKRLHLHELPINQPLPEDFPLQVMGGDTGCRTLGSVVECRGV